MKNLPDSLLIISFNYILFFMVRWRIIMKKQISCTLHNYFVYMLVKLDNWGFTVCVLNTVFYHFEYILNFLRIINTYIIIKIKIFNVVWSIYFFYFSIILSFFVLSDWNSQLWIVMHLIGKNLFLFILDWFICEAKI